VSRCLVTTNFFANARGTAILYSRGGQTTAREPHAVLRAFRKIIYWSLFLFVAKYRNIVKW